MATYMMIEHKGKWYIRKTTYGNSCMIDEYFGGYDFMGSVEWIDSGVSNRVRLMDRTEAEQIVKDLEAAEDADKEIDHMVKTPEISFEISERKIPLEKLIERVEKEWHGWRFDRTESRYQSCIMAIFVKD